MLLLDTAVSLALLAEPLQVAVSSSMLIALVKLHQNDMEQMPIDITHC